MGELKNGNGDNYRHVEETEEEGKTDKQTDSKKNKE